MSNTIEFTLTFDNTEVLITAYAIQGTLFETMYSGKVLHTFYTGLWTANNYRGRVVEDD